MQNATLPKAPTNVPQGENPAATRALLDRMTFGYTTAEADRAIDGGVRYYIEEQLNPQSIDDSAFDARLAALGYVTLDYTLPQLYAAAVQGQAGTIRNQLINATILRAVFSRRQLFERMVEFWSDHFCMHIFQEVVDFAKTYDDRHVVRANALGNFGAMLRASAQSTAMLAYLDNNTNIVGRPNENYARELLELHTLGVDGGYTQEDVRQVARCFTGWTYYTSGLAAYMFRYNNAQHDQGAKVIFAGTPQQLNIAANGGITDGERVLTALINHPSTAKFIARKMLRRFWGENPPQSHVNAIAAIYTATGGEIKPMIRAILNMQVTGLPALKYKRPFHLLTSALRALNATVGAPDSLRNPLAQAGHLPFNWSPPDGYPDTLQYWAGGQLQRWNIGAALMNNEYSQATVDAAALTAGLTTADQIANRMGHLLCSRGLAPADRAKIVTYLGAGVPSLTKIREAFGLAIASPSFQWF